MKVQDVMTRNVRTVGRDTPLKEVARILSELGVSGLPVVNEAGKVVGVVSEVDILFKERAGKPDDAGLIGLLLEIETLDVETKLGARTAGEAMTAPVISIGPNRPLAEAAAKMLDERVSRLPVLDEDGKLAGIVTRADLVRAFVRPDEDIAREIKEDVVLRALWISPEQVEVTVKSGEVTIAGTVETKADAELIPSFAERVPGVVSVVSTLSWRANNGAKHGRRFPWVKTPTI